MLNVLPETGFDITLEILQLSVAVTLNVTTALHKPASAFWVISDGQVITGFSASFTVTVNEQLLVLP
jgi:hypothetical protein